MTSTYLESVAQNGNGADYCCWGETYWGERGETRRETEGFKSQRTGTKTLCWNALHHATVPWSFLSPGLAQNTHSCLFQIFDTKWQNVPEGLPPPAEQRRMFREKIYSAKKYTRLSAKKYTLNTINLILIYCFDLNDLQRIQRIW